MSLSTETSLHSANCAADREDLTGTVLVWLSTRPLLCSDRCRGSDGAEFRGAAMFNAPRSQKTARASGKHPGVLKEPEVQLEAATVGYVAASTPLLVVASLAGGDEVDATTTRYLLKCALRKRQKDESSWQPMSAAQRRRQRRLRSMLRHEQQTVRMALAAALHHSAGPKEKVEMQQNGAPRGQKIAARAGEVRTPAYGHRRLLHRGSGQASRWSPGRRGATAPCGAPQGIACRPSPCPFWQGRQVKLWTRPPSASSRPLR